MSVGESSDESASQARPPGRGSGKRPGRKTARVDEKAKLEKSRQSARECRARKKLRYQYLEELVLHRERAVLALRGELETLRDWCYTLEQEQRVPQSLLEVLHRDEQSLQGAQTQQRQIVTSSSFSLGATPLTSQSTPTFENRLSRRPHSSHVQLDQSTPSSSGLARLSSEKLEPKFRLGQQTQPEQNQQTLQAIEIKETPTATRLRRQIAFDVSDPAGSQQNHTLEAGTSSETKTLLETNTSSQTYTQRPSQPSPNTIFIRESSPSRSTGSKSFATGHQSSQIASSQRSAEYEPRIKYKPPSEGSISVFQERISSFGSVRSGSFPSSSQNLRLSAPGTSSNTSDVSPLTPAPSPNVSCSAVLRVKYSESDHGRPRSHSNPASMVSLQRDRVPQTSLRNLSTSSGPSRISISPPSSLAQQHSHRLGLFTGSAIKTEQDMSLLNIPTTVSLDESSSSDDNTDQPSLHPPNRPTPPSSNWILSSTGNLPASVHSNVHFDVDPLLRLSQFSPVRCSSSTPPSITPSSSRRTLPSVIPSSTQHYSHTSNKPTSIFSRTTPVQPTSLQSMLYLPVSSAGLSTPSFTSPLTEMPSSSSPLDSPGILLSLTDSESGLAASIEEQIPGLYSLLDDLVQSDLTCLSSRHGASSTHGTPLALTPAPQEPQATSPDPAPINVPTVVQEYLDSDK